MPPDAPLEPVIAPGAVPEAAIVVPVEPAAYEAGTATPEPAIALHTDTPTLLESAVEAPKPEAKPGEVKAEETKPEVQPEDKPAEAKAPEVPEAPKVEAVPLTHADFTLPEGIQPDKERLGQFASVLNEFGVSKEVGQKLLEQHTASLTAYHQNTLADQHKTFSAMRTDWRNQIMGDDQLGGAGFDTVKAAVARTRDLLVPEKDKAAFNEFLLVTGAGDHPAFWRMLHNAARFLDEPVPLAGTKPAPDAHKPPGKSRLSGIYDHPSSSHNR